MFRKDNKTSILANCYQRSKIKIQIEGIEVEGLVDTDTDATIISPKSWHPGWPLQEVNIQLLRIVSQVKQSTKWVECIGPEGQMGKLKPSMANTAINLWGCDLYTVENPD